MRYCTKCGSPLQDDAKFCTKCGTPVKMQAEGSALPKESKPHKKASGATKVMIFLALLLTIETIYVGYGAIRSVDGKEPFAWMESQNPEVLLPENH